jgi:hypothetical protein
MRELQLRVSRPSSGEGSCKICFLCEKILRSVSHSTRFDEENLCLIVEKVGEKQIDVGEPWQP